MSDEDRKYGTLITRLGMQLMAESFKTAMPINIAEIAVGDGNGNYYEPDENMTGLKNERWRGAVTEKTIDPENPHIVTFHTILPASAGGFWVRELAAYDDKGNMTHIGNYPDAYKVLASSGATSEFPIAIQCLFTNVENISLEIDPNVAVATQKWVLNRMAEKIFIPINHGLNCYPQVMVAACPHSAGISGAGNGPAGGADMESFPAKPIYHGRNSLTIKTVKPVVELGSQPTLHRLSATEYAVTFADNPTTSVYIQLICSTSTGTPSPPTDAVAIKNMVFSTTPPSDTSVLWGEPN